MSIYYIQRGDETTVFDSMILILRKSALDLGDVISKTGQITA